MTLPDDLLAAIRSEPDADAPRLAAADWLDEHGDPDWAALIRAECGPIPMGPRGRRALAVAFLRRVEPALGRRPDVGEFTFDRGMIVGIALFAVRPFVEIDMPGLVAHAPLLATFASPQELSAEDTETLARLPGLGPAKGFERMPPREREEAVRAALGTRLARLADGTLAAFVGPTLLPLVAFADPVSAIDIDAPAMPPTPPDRWPAELRSLRLDGRGIDEPYFFHGLPSLRELRVRARERATGAGVLRLLSEQASLRVLHYGGAADVPEGLIDAVNGHPELRHLRLSAVGLRERDLLRLRLPKLLTLELPGTLMNAADFAGLPALRFADTIFRPIDGGRTDRPDPDLYVPGPTPGRRQGEAERLERDLGEPVSVGGASLRVPSWWVRLPDPGPDAAAWAEWGDGGPDDELLGEGPARLTVEFLPFAPRAADRAALLASPPSSQGLRATEAARGKVPGGAYWGGQTRWRALDRYLWAGKGACVRVCWETPPERDWAARRVREAVTRSLRLPAGWRR